MTHHITDERLAEVLTEAYGSPEWTMADVRAARAVEAAVLALAAPAEQWATVPKDGEQWPTVPKGGEEWSTVPKGYTAPAPAVPSDERKAFEAGAVSVGYHTERDMFQRDKYQSTVTWELWRVWKARAALTAAPTPPAQPSTQPVRLSDVQRVLAEVGLDLTLTARAPGTTQPAQSEPMQLGELAKRNVYDAIRGAYDLGYNDARNARAVPGDSAPGYKGRNVEADHGGALLNSLNQRLRSATAVPESADTTPPALHPDDAAVDRFAIAMKTKLAASRAKGRGGWDDPAQCSVEHLARLLVEHIAKGDPVDVANFAMMLHQRGAGRAVLAAAQPAVPDDVARANQQMLEALEAIASDYAERFDLSSPSTNPGIKSTIAQARAAIDAARAAEKGGA